MNNPMNSVTAFWGLLGTVTLIPRMEAQGLAMSGKWTWKKIAEWYAKRNALRVTAKITTPQSGYVINHILEGGKVVFSKGLSNSGTSDFIISEAGEVALGSGHWFMSGGSKVVKGAGTLSLKNGQIDTISNWSGHYKPTTAQLDAAVEYLKKAGYTFTNNFQKLITQ